MTATRGKYMQFPPTILNQQLLEESSTKKHRLGTHVMLEDGRVFAYAKMGAAAVSPAHLLTVISTPTHEDTVTVAHAIGTYDVTVTGAGVTANQFEDGYLVVTEGTGIGEMYKIHSNSAADGSNLVTVKLYDPIQTAWVAANTDVDLYVNPFNGLVVNPADGQQKPVGVSPMSFTASYYGWVCVHGFCALKLDVASAAGLELDEKLIQPSTNHAGQGMLTTTPANSDMKHICGFVVKEQDVADDTATLVFIDLG